jgi:HEAT repeat protein
VLTATGCYVGKPADITTAYTDARSALLEGTRDEDPSVRIRALEGLVVVRGSDAGGVLEAALKDNSPAVRFAAALGIGDTGYFPAKDTLLQMAADKKVEPDKSVRPGVIYALFKMGDSGYVGELWALLQDRDKAVRANTARVMGKMGEPSAIGPLRSMLDNEWSDRNRLRIIESLAMLGDTRSLHLLEAFCKVQNVEDRLIAISAMAHVRSPRAKLVLSEMLSEIYDPCSRTAAAGALSRLGLFDKRGYESCVWAVHDPLYELNKFSGGRRTASHDETWLLREVGAKSLGEMKHLETVDMLAELLESANGGVRVAGATALMQILAFQQKVASKTDLNATTATPEAVPEKPVPLNNDWLDAAGSKY